MKLLLSNSALECPNVRPSFVFIIFLYSSSSIKYFDIQLPIFTYIFRNNYFCLKCCNCQLALLSTLFIPHGEVTALPYFTLSLPNPLSL